MILITCFFCVPDCHAQKLLDKRITVSVKAKPVAEVLKLIGQQGQFAFSYNSDIIPGDSVVSISMSAQVRQVLDRLLLGKYLYKDTGNYIIIQKAPPERYAYISGVVVDGETQEAVDYASVYSREHLISALTDADGSFKLRLRHHQFPVTLTISKIGYADTSVVLHSETDAGMKISIHQKSIDLDTLTITNGSDSRFWLARLLVSSRLRAQSRNITRFFVTSPFQVGLTPGLSTHGKMASQITNKVSLNVYGSYTAGVNGVELSGLFNISRKDVRYLQMANMFNIVSGNMKGVQIAGISNVTQGNASGTQLSGLGNVSGGTVRGVQLAFLFNYAKNLRGVQVALVNLADSSSGYSVGLLNIVKKGSGAIAVFASEMVPWNVAWKTGNKKLYNIFNMGASMDRTKKAFLFGLGLGHESALSSTLRLNTEITFQKGYLGDWDKCAAIYQLHTGLNLKLAKRLSLIGGPSFSVFQSEQKEFRAGYQSFSDKGFFHFNTGHQVQGWLGWRGGLSWNYGRR
ncbi:carboxypeptidase-like regulatory domain-containing protein [Dyadobacter helix]|nr:carboxypeptidase-like regulatory domain-containing protein [Dyadobacter sp. CECT 9275]